MTSNSDKVYNLNEQTVFSSLIVPNDVEVFNFKDDLIRKYDYIVFPKSIKEVNGDFAGIVNSGKRFKTVMAFSKHTDVSAIKSLLEAYLKKNSSGGGKTVRELIESGQISAVGDISYALDIVIGGGSSDYNSELSKIKTMEDASKKLKELSGVECSIIVY